MTTDLPAIDLTDLDLFARGAPHDLFDRLRADTPVAFQPEANGRGFWSLTRADDVRTVNRDWPTYSSEWGFILRDPLNEEQLERERAMLIHMDPPRHTRIRLIVNKAFTPRMIERLRERIREIARELIDGIAARGECDFVVDLAMPFPLQVICELLGVPPEDWAQIVEWSNKLTGSDDPEHYESDNQIIDVASAMFAYANELAVAKRAAPTDDIVSVLLQAEVDGERLSDLEFDVFFMLLVVAGNETTRNLVSTGMLALIENPDQHALLVENPALIPNAVEEMLRYGSPAILMRRTAQTDVMLRGQTIHAGDKVVLWYAAANRDPDAFPDPHRFDVTRTPNDHVAFGGGGPHFCLGAHLARLEAIVMFEELLPRIPRMELTGTVEWLRSNMLNGIKHMPVALPPPT